MVCGLSWAKLGPKGHTGRHSGTDFFLGGRCAAAGARERLDESRMLSAEKCFDYKNY